MTDLEARITILERELGALKERQAATDGDVQNLPELVKLEHKFTNTRIDRLARDVSDLNARTDRMARDVSEIKDDVEKLPRAVTEIVHEILAEKASKSGS